MLSDNVVRFLMWPWSDEVINGILKKNKRAPLVGKVQTLPARNGCNNELNTQSRNKVNRGMRFMPCNKYSNNGRIFINLGPDNAGTTPALLNKINGKFVYNNSNKPSPTQTLKPSGFIKSVS